MMKERWRTIDTAEGSRFLVDLQSVRHLESGGAFVTIQATQIQHVDRRETKSFLFSCSGYVEDPSVVAPPIPIAANSDLAEIAELVCQKQPVAETAERPTQAKLAADPFCEGFSEQSCAEMKSTILSRQRPQYCDKIAEYPRSKEQTRICQVMQSPGFAGKP